ncbi:MAG: RNA polymerase subunit sigma-24 [Gallionellales bacterium 35-53-114]|jgi:RNA polymerase sigma-70 factor (ECF subfamily)|nr:MAG: RNA polymerase subunit sigma-24 [Gallionellales bacterium 35-53-114]OYZ62684.1 MAG: RNA polymerase subunit sigma-24 [Gallionellales bacterium 24-53-125]OZB09759.1 MAG: RNA polymerase subunit sigma-24 [Gallionellales bacterium 39-52-133]HQS57678.1 RNA polymerase sigma factor [Gallionellaceae bacterium]HQS74132.1 RNA polymerase sigma factor [Gallionellaceae bacterium]
MKIFSLFGRTTNLQEQIEQIRPRLYRLAYSWSHNPELADDLVQETLIKALKNSSQLRDPALLNSWLFSILANCWRDHFRQHRDMDDIDDIEDYRYAHENTPEKEHSQSQIVSQVRIAVGKLPLGQRQVLTLVDLEELSYIEVASILNIPIGTVMSRLCRARQTMKSLLKELSPQQPAQTVAIRRVK